MVCGGITKDGMPKCKVDPCGVCSLRVKANFIVCLQCVKWISGRCARVKMVTPKLSRNFTCRKCDRNIGEAVEQEIVLCDEVEAVDEFTYLGDRVCVDGGCEAAVTARTRCRWVKVRECVELLYVRSFHLRFRGAVYKSYIRLAMLYESERK